MEFHVLCTLIPDFITLYPAYNNYVLFLCDVGGDDGG
jgi:hypothetical protein